MLGFLLAAICMSAATFADTTLIMTPSQALRAQIRHPSVISSEPIFSESERAALRSLGDAGLADATRIKVRDAQALKDLRAWAGSKRLPIEIEINIAARVQESTHLHTLQWGYQNRGLPQKVAVDELTTDLIPGKVGEDIGAVGAPPEIPGPKITIAVLDTGIALNHPNLRTQLLRKAGECEALANYKSCLSSTDTKKCGELARVDTDRNGYPLDCSGWNLTEGLSPLTGVFGGPDVEDTTGHGTHVAGILGATLVNGSGVRGVAQNISILPIKVIQDSPKAPVRPQSNDLPHPDETSLQWSSGFSDVIARGMLYAIRNDAQIINLSLAWPPGADSFLMRRMTALAQSRGALVVAAAGNDSQDSRVSPCTYAGVICVGAHGPDGALSHFSNYGSSVDLAAPGLGILSTWPTARPSINFTAYLGFEIKNGTSQAAPFVSGALARLLGSGFSPREAFARLLVGTRATPSGSIKFTRTGNADLNQAYSAQPQPLLLPEGKAPIRLQWNGRPSVLPFRFPIRNFWSDAKQVKIEGSIRGARLRTSQWKIDSWPADQTLEIESALEIEDLRMEGRLLLELTITTLESTRKISFPLDVSLVVTPALNSPRVLAFPLSGPTLPPDIPLRTVTSLDSNANQDYIALLGTPSGLRLLLLRETPQHGYEVTANTAAPTVTGSLFSIFRLDADQDGKSDYVFAFAMDKTAKNPITGQNVPILRFQYFDQNLTPLTTVAANGVLEYDNQVSIVSQKFQWMKVQGHRKDSPSKKQDFIVPTWVSRGTTPPLDKPRFDPWNPKPADPVRLRLYYLAPEGLHAVATESKDAFFAELLAPTTGLRAAGQVSALIAKGTDFNLSFELATIDHGKIASRAPLELDSFKMLVGSGNVTAIQSLHPDTLVSGTAFSSGSLGGLQTTTAILQDAAGKQTGQFDFTQRPPSRLESVTQFSSLSLGAQRKSAFAQTHYQLQFDDLVTGESATTGLDRFSFLPAFVFNLSFFPVVVRDETAAHRADRLPGMLVPAGLGVYDGNEVILPRYSGGHLQGLTRPAALRMVAGAGCQDLGDPIAASSSNPTQLVFFCGDRFLRVSLGY